MINSSAYNMNSHDFDSDYSEFFKNKCVLITGGTGTFGHALVEKLQLVARKVIVLSRDEYKQHLMKKVYDGEKMRYFIGDVRSKDRLMLATKGVNFVFHLAALKQVVVAEHDPLECVLTNIHGAENLIEASLANGVEKVLAISTDKAASPSCMYGASKLASEKLFIAANNYSGTLFSVLRCGNLSGSRGSVLEVFQALLKGGLQPLPVTHPEMTRFWMTLHQAAKFALKAACLMKGGETFIPKVPSIRIMDLAQIMGGKEPQIVGIRPGEKLNEIMCTHSVTNDLIEFDDHYVFKPTIPIVGNPNYAINSDGVVGKNIEKCFEFSSDSKELLLDKPQIREFLKAEQII